MRRAIMGLAAGLIVSACATAAKAPPAPGAPVAPAQPGTPFSKLTPEMLSTRMGQMTERLRRVEDLILLGNPTPGDREQIVTLLQEMKALADKLDPATDFGGHPGFEERLSQVRADAAAAVAGAKADPPDFQPVGRFSQSCTQCHMEPI